MKKLYFLFATIIYIVIIGTGCSKKNIDNQGAPDQSAGKASFSVISPATALPNSAVRLLGSDFPTDISKISVSFNGTGSLATVYSATSTEIVIGVPPNAKTGYIELKINGATVTSTANFTVLSATQTTFANAYLEHIGIDAAGNAYGDGVSATSVPAILKISPAGVVSNLVGGSLFTPTQIKNVWGTAVDKDGNVYYVDRDKYRIVRVGTNGSVDYIGNGKSGYVDGFFSVAQFVKPIGLAIDAAGNLYTNDAYRVRKISPTGVVSTLAGRGIAGFVDDTGIDALIGSCDGIAVDAAGNVYIDDNKSVRKITPTGVVTTLAGNGTAGFTDGQGKSAQFYQPQGMAVDATGNIFVADNQFSQSADGPVVYTIRMVNKAGGVSSFIKSTHTVATAPLNVINGPIAIATANFPDGIAFDSAGNMYICNSGASPAVVSKITIN